MKVLIVYGHPNPNSFNHAILEEFTKGLKDGGHTYEVIDLYAMKFNPVFGMEDYNFFAHETVLEDILEEMDFKGMIMNVVGRRPFGFIKKTMAKRWMEGKTLSEIAMEIGKHKPKDILEHQEKVANADALVYIFPVIWNNFPAIFLGWMQRVIQYGFAYLMDEKGWHGDVDGRISLLKHKKALIINTTFFKEKDMKERGFHDAMEKIMDEWSLKYPGIKNVEHVYFYSVISVGEETRKGYLQRAYQLGKELELYPKTGPVKNMVFWPCTLSANCSANCRGVKSPSELCGRNSLYSSRHISIFSRASSIDKNQFTFRHSSRKVPLNDSIIA